MPASSPENPPPVVVIMGVCGCGKTAVGQLVAARLGVPFRDADHFHTPENVERMRSGQPLDDEARVWRTVARTSPRIVHRMVPAEAGVILVGGAAGKDNLDRVEWVALP